MCRSSARAPALAGTFAELDGRHVCLFTDAATPARGTAGDRGPAVPPGQFGATFASLPRDQPWEQRHQSIHLDSLGITSMTTMTYADPDFGPTAGAVRCGQVRRGPAGPFPRRLAGQPFEPAGPNRYVVHETAAEYGRPRPPREARTTPRVAERSRIGSVLWRAGSRAAALALPRPARGGDPLLTRAARVLEGRGDRAQAARYWCSSPGWRETAVR